MENLSRRDKEKQTHEKEILTAAERIFCENGYEDASMDEIAKEARFTKRTVYQYFENKDDLYFAVALGGLKKLMSKIRDGNKKEQTGYDRLEKSCRTYDQFYRDNPQLIDLMNCWGHTKVMSGEAGKNKGELIRFNHVMIQEIADMIDDGKEDGSIQFSIDTEQTAFCLMLLITGFYNQLSAAGDHFASRDVKEQEGLMLHTIELLIKPLKRSKTVTMTRKGTA